MLPHLLAQLDAFCAARPLRPKVLFAPTVQSGAHLTTALAQAGTSIIHLQVTTPAAWAARYAAPYQQAQGKRRLAGGTGPFLLQQALDALEADTELQDAVQQLTGDQNVSAVLRAVRDLRAAGITPEMLREAPLPGAKGASLARVLRAYTDGCARYQCYDPVTLFQEGIRQVQHVPPSETAFAILDATRLSTWAYRFVEAVSDGQLTRIGTPGPRDASSQPPPDSAAVRWAGCPLATDDGTVHPAAALWADGLTPTDRSSVRLRTAPGAQAEVRGVLRDVLTQRIPLDHVEVVYTAETPYMSSLWTAAERFGIPMTFGDGRPALLTRAGRALRGFFRWIAQGCDPHVLGDLCRACLLTFDRVIDPPLSSPAVAAVLDRGALPPGRRSHHALIDRLDAQCAADDEAERERLAQVRTALDACAALVPDALTVTTEALATAGITFLERFGPEASDAAAVKSLIERLRDVASSVAKATGPRVRLAALLQQLVEAHRVEAAAARPGALHVVPLDRAGYTHRLHTYVVGLDESLFPTAPPTDPVLPDGERAALEGLVASGDCAHEAEWHLARALHAASGTVTLCARTHSLSEGTALFPSALFQRAAEQLGYNGEDGPTSAVPSFHLVPALDAVALDATEQLLAGRHADGFAATVRAEAPCLVRGEHARAQRVAPSLTRFDGLTGALAPRHALGNGQTPVSASQLETLAACPFRYFLKYVLDVAPPDRPEDDPARWLDPMQFGRLVHELYHTFMQHHRERIASHDEATDALMALVDETIEAYRARIPVQREAAFRADQRRIKRAASVFLAAEAQRSDAEPVAFEVSFGQGVAFGPHRAAPVTVMLTEDVQLQLQGRIDRVDRLSCGDYAIWDYKTGSMQAYDVQDLGAGGQRLQWALYAYAFEAMLQDAGRDGTVARSGYFFANERAFGQRLSATPPSRKVLGAQLRPLLDLAQHGAFPHVQKRRDACRFCDYRRLCAEESKTARDVSAITEEMADHPISEILARWMGST